MSSSWSRSGSQRYLLKLWDKDSLSDAHSFVLGFLRGDVWDWNVIASHFIAEVEGVGAGGSSSAKGKSESSFQSVTIL